ncbi:MAG TPA: polyamine ABC transporter substrate-binding protein [Acetobacteraceae bacterium]|nr:polyamine ABC transporter substrate-binding protein [Acetobacteraceae bacterium]
MTVLALALAAQAHAQDRVLNVYNWTDYIDPKVLQRFTKETGIKVQYDVYDSLETLEGKLLAGRSGYDIVVPTSEPTFSRLIRAGALLPLDKAKIPNLKNLDPALMKRVETSDPGNKYGAIYLWGTIGLGMLPDKIKALAPNAPMDSWDLLFKPENAKAVAPCGIVLMDSAIDTIPSVLKYLGKNPESSDPKDLEAVEKTLMAIRPYIRTFASGGALEMLASGQICLAMDYSGDVVQAAARAKEARQARVEYVLPKEFTELSFDMLAVPKDAPHPAEAMQFINFILQPDVMAAITNQVGYPNAVPASLPLVRDEVKNNPNVFPPASTLSRAFTAHAPSPAADRARTRMWARFKAGS